ncbi:uncharacterized protein LOC124274005 [Haliotis rubra]|uniref:uncharacterized protein LOC124274005 n=1 Tax=Haliotis rubra TaxID=36100 RepID=UPI001EE5E7AB|nr:uncharacterized protein LOC124274005 [Haliotis rubra]
MLVSGWSEVYALVKQCGSNENYTVVREGHSALIIWQMPLVGEGFFVGAPANTLLFNVDASRVYIYDSYQTRVNIMQLTTTADSVIIRFWLHNATYGDAGKYQCSTRLVKPIPNCHHMLYVQDFQQPYIAAPDTAHVDRSVTLSCFSVFKLHGPDDVKLMVSINWRRNGLLVNDRIEYNVTRGNHAWGWGMTYYRSILTVSDVSTAKGDNFQCQAVLGPRAVSGWSEVYALVKQSGSYENYTVVREGHSCLITLKMPWNKYFKVMGPGNKRLFEVDTPRVHSDKVYIWNSYRTRVNITKITRSVDAVILQFSLHNATSEDAGRYHCSTWSDGPIPNCQHMLYVQGKPAHSYISVVVNTTIMGIIVDKL